MAAGRRRADERDDVVPPPEQSFNLIGHESAEAELLSSLASGRPHHAWLISGSKGIGKATLAFRFARFLLRHGQDEAAVRGAKSLDVPASDPIGRQVASGAAQDLLVIRRPRDERTGALKSVITVDEVRRLGPFFGLAAGAGGWRIAIIDAVDELNRNAANALLKSLEEPPERALLLLIANAPGRTLATIRSRCRPLYLAPLSPQDLTARLPSLVSSLGLGDPDQEQSARLAKLAGGRVGRALDLWVGGGLDLSRLVDETLSAWPDLSPQRSAGLLDRSRQSYDIATDLIVATLRGAARRRVTDARAPSEEGGAIQRLASAAAPEIWAELASDLENFFARGEAINLDERAMMGEALRRIAGVARA